MYVVGTNKGNYYAISNEGSVLAKFNGTHHWVEQDPNNPRFRVSCYFDPFLGKARSAVQSPKIGYKRITEDRRVGRLKESNGIITVFDRVESLEQALTKITELQHRAPRFP